MCDPVIGGAVAASSLGMLLNNRAQNKAAGQREDFAKAEAERQAGFADQGEAAAFDSLNLFGNPAAMAAGAGRQNVMDRTLAQHAPQVMQMPGSASAPAGLGAMINQIVGAGAAEGKRDVRTGVKLRQTNDSLAENARKMGNNVSSISFLGNQANRSAGAANAEIAGVGPGTSLLGDVLTQGGNIGALYGATRIPGAPAPGGAPGLGASAAARHRSS